MRKQLIILFLALAATGLGFSGGWQDAYWTGHNTNIYQYFGVEVWNTNVMHASLESLELEKVDQSAINNSAVKDYVARAITYKSRADNAKMHCEKLYSNLADQLSYTAISIVVDPTGVISRVFASMAAYMVKNDYDECRNYGTYWKETMNYAENAIKKSNSEMASSYEAAGESAGRAAEAGLCDDDFSGIAKELCMNATNTVNGRLGSIAAGSEEYYMGFETEGNNNAPNMSGYSETINSIWKEGIPLAAAVSSNSEEAVSRAGTDYKSIKAVAEEMMRAAKQSISDLKAERVFDIAEADYSAQSGGTVEQRYAEITALAGWGDGHYVNATISYSSNYRGGMKNAINEMKMAHKEYELAAGKSPELLADAERIAEEEREYAEGRIKDFEAATARSPPSTAAKALYEDAVRNLELGDESGRVGEKFAYYREAGAKATEAKNVNGNGGADVEATANAAKKQLEDTIMNAKKDGIDVYSEEAELALVSGTSYESVTASYGKMVEGIMEKACLKYCYLEQKRETINEKIMLAGGKLDDLKFEMAKAENGVMGQDGRLDISSGIGRLADLARAYQYADAQADKELPLMVANGMKTDLAIAVGDIELDSVANISAQLFVYNPYGYGAKNVMVSIPTWLELRENEITDGAEYVSSASYANGKLNIFFSEFDAYEMETIGFQKQEKIANLLKMDVKAYGNPDGSANVDENADFQLSYDVNGVFVPEKYEKWAIDGKEGTGMKTGALARGEHRLAGSYTVPEAFSLETGDYRAIATGLDSEMNYDITLMPAIDMEYASIMVNAPDPASTSGFSVTPYSAGIGIRNRRNIGNGVYSFEITGLKEGQRVTLRASYTVSRSLDYAKEQIAIMNGNVQSTVAGGYLQIAEEAAAKNDSKRALEYVEKARNQIEAERIAGLKEEEQKEKEIDKLVDAKDEMDEAIEYAGKIGLNSTSATLALLDARKESIEAAIAGGQMESFDYSWEKKEAAGIKKEANEEYNRLKNEYLKANGGNADDAAFSNFESAMARLDVSGGLKDAITVQKRLEEVRKTVAGKTSNAEDEYDVAVAGANAAKGQAGVVLAAYIKEYDDAKGGQTEALFTYDYRASQKDMKAVDNLIAKKADADSINQKSADIREGKNRMEGILGYITNESARKIASLKQIYAERMGSMDEKSRKLAEQGLLKMEEQINMGNYAQAIETGEAVVKIISGSGQDGNAGLVVLGLTALLVIGAIVIYLIRGGKKERKQFRKLRSLDDQGN